MLCLVTGSLVFLKVMKTIKSRFPERVGCFGTFFSPFIACISPFQSSQQMSLLVRLKLFKNLLHLWSEQPDVKSGISIARPRTCSSPHSFSEYRAEQDPLEGHKAALDMSQHSGNNRGLPEHTHTHTFMFIVIPGTL